MGGIASRSVYRSEVYEKQVASAFARNVKRARTGRSKFARQIMNRSRLTAPCIFLSYCRALYRKRRTAIPSLPADSGFLSFWLSHDIVRPISCHSVCFIRSFFLSLGLWELRHAFGLSSQSHPFHLNRSCKPRRLSRIPPRRKCRVPRWHPLRNRT